MRGFLFLSTWKWICKRKENMCFCKNIRIRCIDKKYCSAFSDCNVKGGSFTNATHDTMGYLTSDGVYQVNKYQLIRLYIFTTHLSIIYINCDIEHVCMWWNIVFLHVLAIYLADHLSRRKYLAVDFSCHCARTQCWQ